MRFRPPTRPALRTAAALAAALAAPDLLALNYGRELVLGEALTTYISPEGDVDDLVFDAGAGWKFSAKVKAVKDEVLDPDGEWDLAPTLALVAPDGTLETNGVTVKAKGASASLAATLLEGGRFALRVRGASGLGGCVVNWKLAPAKVAPPLKGSEVQANQTVLVDVPARGGALLSWKMKFQGDGDAQVAAVRDPAGADAGYDPEDSDLVVRTLTSESVKDFPLPASGPGGNWRLVIENRLASSFVTLSVQVKLPKAPKTSNLLTVREPALDGISHSTSTCGVVVTLTGTDLGDSPRGVFFGTKSATGVSVVDGRTVTCSVPGGSGSVDVVYVAADGQEAVLPGAFTFKPLPTLTGFDPTVGPGVGRIEMHLFGTGFETEGQGLYEILVGGVPGSRVQVLSPTEISLQIPANVSGPKTVLLRNLCGETVVAPGSFDYSALLSISNIIPNAVPVFGGIPVTVYGAGLNASDTVYLDNAPVASTPVLYSGTVIGHRIDGAQVAAHAPGRVDVEVRDAGTRSSKKTGGLAYYTFADATPSAIPAATTADDWGGVSTAAGDSDGNGTVDWIAIADSAKLSATRPGTRILANNGSGVFTDGTAIRMPAPDLDTDFGANAVLAARFNSDTVPDLYLSRPGTGDLARRTSDSKYVASWGRMLLGDSGGGFSPQEWQGVNSKFSIPGILSYQKCFSYDFDFRSVAAATGDLDGDLDQDIALVNDASIQWYTGSGCNYRWQTCAGGYYTACLDAIANPNGSALRICTTGGTGGLFDRTSTMLASGSSSSDDFRGAALAVGDMSSDFLNDIVVVHNQGLPPGGGNPLPATRMFKQKNLANIVTFTRQNNFLPQVTAGSDDWRGDAVALPDLNADLYRDLVLGLDADLPGGGAFSTRILIQNTLTSALEDRTSSLLSGVLPAGDKAHAKAVLAVDLDRDGDSDLVISTPGSAGAGNRRTRYLLNAYRDETTGIPVFVDASSLFPAESSDPGNAVALLAVDVNGDGNLDLVLTDTRVPGGTVRRTRVWTQVR